MKQAEKTTQLGAKIQHSKRRGEWAEMCFQGRAAAFGLEVSKPWGESASYDFIVEKSRHMARVQVKSTTSRSDAGYNCQLRNSAGNPYKGDLFDFVAVYVIPEDIWYIVPAKVLLGKSAVALSPSLKRSKYSQYREAWHLLPGAFRSTRIKSLQACAEQWPPTFARPRAPCEASQAPAVGV